MGLGLGSVLPFIVWMVFGAAALANSVPEPETYRTTGYGDPTPATLDGARVITTEEAYNLWEQGQSAFIDVLPRAERPPGLPEDTLWIDPTRDTVPGAIWLPNTGFGKLSAARTAYLKHGLDRASGGDLTKPLVFLCLSNCWMSWNAARRALLELGFTSVIWYPDGTDGWEQAGHPTETIDALPK